MDKLLKNHLHDILDFISNIEEAIQGVGYDDYYNDRKRKIEVVDYFQKLIEKVNSFMELLKAEYPDIDWISIIELKEKFLTSELILNDEEVWKAAKHKIVKLKRQIKEKL